MLATTRALESRADKLAHLAALLESVNYQRVLERGFALVKDGSGKLITSAKAAAREKEIELTFRDGKVTTQLSS